MKIKNNNYKINKNIVNNKKTYKLKTHNIVKKNTNKNDSTYKFKFRKNAINRNNKLYYIYIIECENNFLYTGVTTDYDRRFKEHARINGKSDKGAKFTKYHKPLKIVALWKTISRSNAQKLEFRIKHLTKLNKLNLIKNNKLFKILFESKLECNLYKRIKKY